MNTMFENLYACKELHSILFYSVCTKYNLTIAEILVLLYLANAKGSDTAKDIVDKLKLTKSHVSLSVRSLKIRGYLAGSYEDGNHRTVHLSLCDAANAPVADARQVEAKFVSIIEKGFSSDETAAFQEYLSRATDNMNAFLNSAK